MYPQAVESIVTIPAVLIHVPNRVDIESFAEIVLKRLPIRSSQARAGSRKNDELGLVRSKMRDVTNDAARHMLMIKVDLRLSRASRNSTGSIR